MSEQTPDQLYQSDLVSLAQWLQQTTENTPGGAALPGPGWLRPVSRLAGVFTPAPAPAATSSSFILPSGLNVAEASEVAGLLAEAASHLLHRGQSPDLSPGGVWLAAEGRPWPVKINSLPTPTPPDLAAVRLGLARLYYHLVTGPAPAPSLWKEACRRLATTFPETAAVLENAAGNEYSSLPEMAGAFGWSLYREQQNRAMALSAPKRNRRGRPTHSLAGAAPLPDLTRPAPLAPSTRTGRATVLGLAGLGVIMLAIFVGLLLLPASPTPLAESASQLKPSPSLPPPTPTDSVLQNTRSPDGAQQTRFNPALAGANQAAYTGPGDLKPEGVTALGGPPVMQIANAQWTVGQNLYMSLNDGGWEVWDTASNRRISRRELPGVEQYVIVSWSPDGDNFAAVDFEGQLRLGSNGRVLKTLPFILPADGAYWQLNLRPSDFSWSPNGTYLLAGANSGQMALISFENNIQQISPPGSTAPNARGFLSGRSGQSWDWSADSRYLAVFLNNPDQVAVYETRTLRRLYQIDLSEPAPSSSSPASSPSTGALYTTASAGFSKSALSWSPDGRKMALVQWAGFVNSTSGQQYLTPARRVLTIFDLPAGAGATSSGGGEVVKPSLKQVLADDNSSVYLTAAYLDWSSGGRLLLAENRIEYQVAALGLPSRSVGRLTVYNRLDILNPWKPETTFTLPPVPGAAQDWPGSIFAEWSREGRRLLVSDQRGFVGIYTLSSTGSLQPEKLASAPEQLHSGGWNISPDGQWLVAPTGLNRVTLRQAATGQIIATLDPPEDAPGVTFNWSGGSEVLKWSTDGRYLAAVYLMVDQALPAQTIVRVWKVESDPASPGFSFSFHGDLLLQAVQPLLIGWNSKAAYPEIVFQVDQYLAAWDVRPVPPALAEQRKPLKTALYRIVGQIAGLNGPLTPPGSNYGYGVEPVWFSDWSGVLLSAGVGSNSGATIYKLRPPGQQSGQIAPVALDPNPDRPGVLYVPSAVHFSPDKRLLAIGTVNGLVQVYETAGGKLVQAFNAHRGLVTGLRFSPDSHSLATISTDRTVRVWDTTTWRNTYVLRGHPSPVRTVSWLPDSTGLLSSSGPSFAYTLIWKFT